MPRLSSGVRGAPRRIEPVSAPCHDPASRGQRDSNMRLFHAWLGLFLVVAVPAQAAQCGGDFHAFLSTMSREAQAAGVSRPVIDQALAGVTQDQAVLAFDRRQRSTFNMS